MLCLNTLCWLCQQPLQLPQFRLCRICQTQMISNLIVCPTCGQPHDCHKTPCLECQHSPPLWQNLIFVSHYHPPLSTLISRFKFHSDDSLAPMLARLLLLAWLNARRSRYVIKPDLLVSVPLHKKRGWVRGFNQSALLAKQLARWLNCRWEPNLIQRLLYQPPQTTLKRQARTTNLLNAFACTQSVEGQHIVIVDDVITTGSTVKEISKCLLDQGAASIQVCCLCRTL